MSIDKARIEKLIRDAFRGVTLGEGIGLREGVGLDQYADSDSLAASRRLDERKNWESISWEELSDYCDSLSYFDALGMRFHLPAFLISELHDWSFHNSIMFHLTYIREDDQRWELLTAEQKHAVREFLIYKLSILEEPGLSFEGPLIEMALKGRWRA